MFISTPAGGLVFGGRSSSQYFLNGLLDMNPSTDSMIEPGHSPTPTPWVELQRTEVTAERVRRFLRGAAPEIDVPDNPRHAPLTFALALRSGHGPELVLSPYAFSIHGGHDITQYADILVGSTYTVRARVERIFRKTGRSGPMTMVERRVLIHDEHGDITTEITDRQVVRWRPTAATAASAGSSTPTVTEPDDATPQAPVGDLDQNLDVGEVIGPFHRRGPRRTEISGWATALRERETLFHDREGSQALGYRDLVVPGPMQSAIVDRLLAATLDGWQTTRLNMTFRQSLVANEPLEIDTIVVDAERDTRTLDIVIRNSSSGETASVGMASLHRLR